MIPPLTPFEPVPILSVVGHNNLTIARLATGETLIRNASGRVVVPAEARAKLREKLLELDSIPRLSLDRDEVTQHAVAGDVELWAFGDGEVVIVVGPYPSATIGLEIPDVGRVARALKETEGQ